MVGAFLHSVTRPCRRPCGAVVCLVALLAACSSERGLVPQGGTPFVYVALSGLSSADSTSALHALVMTSGDPARARYLTPAHFRMRRVSDRAAFGWAPVEQSAAPPADFARLRLTGAGNVTLPVLASVRGLGRAALEAGVEYELDVLVDDIVVTGRTRMPDRPRLSIVAVDSAGPRRRVVWRPVPAAALYVVESETELFGGALVPDTAYTLREDAMGASAAATRLRVYALDRNLARYWLDTAAVRSGITGAYGMFGSYSVADTLLPSRGR